MTQHRLATPDDLTLVYDLYMEPSANPFMYFEPMSLPEFEPIYAELLATRDRWLYLEHGEVVAVYVLRYYPYRASHNAYFGGFAVHPTHRGRGVAGRLLHELFVFLKEKGIRRVELLVEDDNLAAIRLYEKLGFVQEGRLRGFTKRAAEAHYTDDLLMAKYLWGAE
jgi:RimJ/RimL family protein N-acetyltransferase